MQFLFVNYISIRLRNEIKTEMHTHTQVQISLPFSYYLSGKKFGKKYQFLLSQK